MNKRLKLKRSVTYLDIILTMQKILGTNITLEIIKNYSLPKLSMLTINFTIKHHYRKNI